MQADPVKSFNSINNRLTSLMNNQQRIRNVAIFDFTQSGSHSCSTIKKLLEAACIRIQEKEAIKYSGMLLGGALACYAKNNILQLIHTSTASKTIDQQYLVNAFFYDSQHSNPTNDWPIFDGAVVMIDIAIGLSALATSLIFQILRKKVRLILIIDKIEDLIRIKSLIQLKQCIEVIILNYNVMLSHFEANENDVASIKQGSIAVCSTKNNVFFSMSNLRKYLPSGRVIDAAYKFMTCLATEQYQKLDTFCNKLFKRQPIQNEQSHISKATFQNDSSLKIQFSLLEMIVEHLPSPMTYNQKIQEIVKGPPEMINTIKKCNPDGPLILYISRFISINKTSPLLAVGRILSGTCLIGKPIRIMSYPDTKIQRNVEQIYVKVKLDDDIFLSIEEVRCGNIIFLSNLDKFCTQSCLLIDTQINFWRQLKIINRKMTKTVRIRVRPTQPQNLPQFSKQLRKIQKTEINIYAKLDETGDFCFEGSLKSVADAVVILRQSCAFSITSNQIEMIYKEVPTASTEVLMTKSQNKHSRIYGKAEPIQQSIIHAIEIGEIYDDQDRKERSKILSDLYDWNINSANRIWCFGQDQRCNMLIDQSKGIQFMNELKPSATSSFHYFTKSGILCDQGVFGMKVEIVDWEYMPDVIHRGGGQLIPACRRLYFALQLKCEPTIYESHATFQAYFPTYFQQGFHHELKALRGQIYECSLVDKNILKIHYQLPLKYCLHFSSQMQKITNDLFHSNLVTEQWKPFVSTEIQTTIEAVMKRRKINGLNPIIPSYYEYIDKLY